MAADMYEIASGFGVVPRNIYRCKYFYVVRCAGSTYSLCKARVDEQRIMNIHRLKEELASVGFNAVDSYRLSSEGLPFVKGKDGLYIMTRFYGAQELNFEDNRQVGSALKVIGRLQNSLRYMADTGVKAAVDDNLLLNRYDNGIRSLKKIKKTIRSIGNKREMDVVMLGCIDEYIDMAETAYNRLKGLKFGRGKLSPTYVHRALKEGNIICSGSNAYIIDWDNMALGHFTEDLSFFIKRYIRKNAYFAANKGENYLSASRLMEIYGTDLSDTELKALKCILGYPERFISSAEEYYRKLRGFIPVGVNMKLSEVIEQRNFEKEYVNSL